MHDFDDNFGGPAEGTFNDPYDLSTIHPIYIVGLVGLIVIVIALCLVGYYLGRQRGLDRLRKQYQDSREAIYGSVRYALDQALKSSGAIILERGREVADILESRVGLLIALNGKLGKAVKALDDALKAEKDAVPVAPGAPKIKVARATEEHYHQVWKALQALNKFWQKDSVLSLIAAAQMELATPPVRPLVTQSFFKRDRPTIAATVAGALSDADKAGSAPLPVVDVPPPVKAEDTPPPPEPTPPLPPAPRPSGGRKLPAHKRNMLA